MLRLLPSVIALVVILVACKDSADRQMEVPQSTSPTSRAPTKTVISYASMLQDAKAHQRPLLLIFTGSDWCTYCQMLEKDVLSTKEWQAFCDNRLTIYTVDLPMNAAFPETQRTQNIALQKTWHIETFPALVLIDTQSEMEIGRLGYLQDGSPTNYINRIKQILSPNPSPASGKPIPLANGALRATTGKGKDISYALSGHTPGEWTLDYTAAVDAAQATNRPILLKFTDTESCRWCKLMNDNVLTQASWQRFARANLIMLALDFSEKRHLPPAMQSRNKSFKNRFNVEGFPTFILLEPDGETLISFVKHELSPRGFRKNVEGGLKLSNSHIATTAKQLSAGDAASFKKTMTELKKRMKKKRAMDHEAQVLFQKGALTKDFNERYKAIESDLTAMDRKMNYYARKIFSAKLPKKAGKRYLQLNIELERAEDGLRQLINHPDRDVELLRSQEAVLALIHTKIDEIEVDYHVSTLPTQAAALYKQLFRELQEKQGAYRSWLAGNPGSDELNNTQDTLFLREINELQDRMDAIRDLQSTKGGTP